jgi:hypothetical protein
MGRVSQDLLILVAGVVVATMKVRVAPAVPVP